MSIMKIKDLTEQIRGVSYKPSDVVTSDVGLPILRANNIKGNSLSFDDLVFVKPERVSKKQILQNGDIVICASSGSKELVGKAGVFSNNDMYSFGAFCKAVRVKRIDGINSNYVRLYFGSKYYRECIAMSSKGSNINNIKTENIEELSINIPSAEEQNIAVSLLNALISAIEHKKQELSSLDELVKSRFIEMFGEPLVNEYNFPKKKLSDTFLLSAGGTPKTDKKEYWDNGTISWIGSNMCQNQILYQNDGKYITELGLKNSSAKIFDVDTVLIALVGATIGKTALLKFPTATNQNVLGIQKIANAEYNPYFVYYYMQGLYDRFIDLGDGKFKMASKGFVGDLEIFVVDLHLQNEFAEFVKLIDKSKFIVQQQIKDLQELLDSKMDEYFR